MRVYTYARLSLSILSACPPPQGGGVALRVHRFRRPRGHLRRRPPGRVRRQRGGEGRSFRPVGPAGVDADPRPRAGPGRDVTLGG